MIRRAIAALTYGDLLMLLKNQTKPYEPHPARATLWWTPGFKS